MGDKDTKGDNNRKRYALECHKYHKQTNKRQQTQFYLNQELRIREGEKALLL